MSANLLRLPVAVAKDAACVYGIDLYGFSDCGDSKFGAGKEISDDGLQVAVDEPRMWIERGEPGREFVRARHGRACDCHSF